MPNSHSVLQAWSIATDQRSLIAMRFHYESTADFARTLDQSCLTIQSRRLVMGQSTPALSYVNH